MPARGQVWNDYWIAAEHRGREPAQIAASVQTLDGLIEAIAVGLGVALSVAPAIDALGAAPARTDRTAGGGADQLPVAALGRRADADRR